MDALDAMTRQAKVMPVALQGFPVGANRYLPYSNVALFNVECVDFAISVLRLGNGARLAMVIFEGFCSPSLPSGAIAFMAPSTAPAAIFAAFVRNIANTFGNIADTFSDVADKCERIKA